jgi:hypothetical protein
MGMTASHQPDRGSRIGDAARRALMLEAEAAEHETELEDAVLNGRAPATIRSWETTNVPVL